MIYKNKGDLNIVPIEITNEHHADFYQVITVRRGDLGILCTLTLEFVWSLKFFSINNHIKLSYHEPTTSNKSEDNI